MSTRIEIHPDTPQPRKVAQVVETLRSGGVIAYPTDTVYGLGCDIREKKALDRVYQIKQMKRDKPVAFVCPDLGDIAKYAIVDDRAYRIMRRLLPGPYTFILNATREVPRMLHMTKKKKTVGIRIPHHEVALAIVRELGNPIVSTSATWEGEVVHDPDDLMTTFSRADLIVDAGFGGLEPSTVVDLTKDEIEVVREGAGSVDLL